MADTDILARLSAFIDYESPELGEFLYRMWGDEAKAITYKELREAILDGSLSLDYLRDWQQDYSRFINEAYRPCVERAIAQAATDLRTEYGVHFNDPMFSKVDSFIETRGGQLIRQVTTEQYTAINQLVRQAALTNTMTVDQLARSIRPCVGLTRRQAQTTKNFYDSLIEDGYSEKRAHERQLVYAAKVHRRRAALIAQTEMAYAYSAGWHATVQQNVEDGVLPPDTKKVWLTAEDEKVCDVCGAMNGETVLWNEPFSNGSEYPPAHPNCRCHHKIEFVDLLPQAQMHLEEPEREQAQIMADGEEYGIGDDYEETFTEVHAPREDAPRYTVLEAETQTDGTGSIIELLPEAGATAGVQIPGRGLLSEAGDGIMFPQEPPSASTRFLNKTDQLYINAANIKPRKGFEDIVCHADKDGFAFRDAQGVESPVSVSEMAGIIKNSGNYRGGAIRLIACDAGAEDGTCAQRLANEMGVNVLAPTKTIFVDEQGGIQIGSTYNARDGKWKLFKPEKAVKKRGLHWQIQRGFRRWLPLNYRAGK